MKKNLYLVIGAIVLAGVAFWGGMTFSAKSGQANSFANFQNMTPEQRQQRISQLGANGGFRRGGAGGVGLTNGEILSADAGSITIKMHDGSSKIILVGDSTKVTKSVDATSADLTQGENVMVNGTTNSDGSLTAQTVQIVPAPVTPTPASGEGTAPAAVSSKNSGTTTQG